jgi:imidazolonepropionase-like amidohydrolase
MRPALLLLLVFVLAAFGCAPMVRIKANPASLIIRNINVIDVQNGIVRFSQDVAVEDEKIAFVGDSFPLPVTASTTFIDGTGKYLVPGLWDMHVHLCWEKHNDSLLFPVLLKHGITGIRDMGGDLTIMREFKRRIQDGQHSGPRIYGAGPMIDGNPPVQPDFALAVDEKSRMESVLDSLVSNGADFFKTYSLIKGSQLEKIAAYCRSTGITFAGHLSEYVEPEVAISLGQKSVEHLNRLDEIWQGNKRRIDTIADLMVKHQTFLCPTLLTYQLKTRLRDDLVIKPYYDRYIPAVLMREWRTTWERRIQRATQGADWIRLEQAYESQKQLVSRLHKSGVMLLAGSDFAGMPYVYPGIGLLEELILLSGAGLSNAEVLRTATINPAIFVAKQDVYGSIAKGKYADMIMLDKNPLEDIGNIQSIVTVIVNGKLTR